jgi:hypothetical protein
MALLVANRAIVLAALTARRIPLFGVKISPGSPRRASALKPRK